MGTWNINSTDYNALFVFPENLGPFYAKFIWEAVSHAAGHAFGLSHDGWQSGANVEERYTGTPTWAPIMADAARARLTQWSKGEYAGATNTEDDLSLLASKLG